MNHLLSKYLVWYPAFFFRNQNVSTELKKIKKTQFYDRENIEHIQFVQFQKMVFFAYENIPFYTNSFKNAGIKPDDIQTRNDIIHIPILTKHDIMNNCGTIYNEKYRGKKFKRSTSGSTGMPLIFYKDSLSMAIMDAVLYRNYSWFDIDIGFKQARFWGQPLNKLGMIKFKLIDSLLNRIRLSPFELEEKNYIKYLQQIENFKPKYIYGYAQSVFQFAKYFYELKKDLSYLKLNAVILTGEMIFSKQINIIKDVFGCNVTEEYGCTELGVIGFKCKNDKMHLMENLLVECVDNGISDKSGEIIVSELYGNLFPLIRYKIGDRGVLSDNKCECGRSLPILESLNGRQDEFIKCNGGKLIDPYLLEYIINDLSPKYGRISQFQIIQKELSSIDVYLVANGNFKIIEKIISSEFMKKLSNDIQINIYFAKSLKKDPSGKNRCFISKL